MYFDLEESFNNLKVLTSKEELKILKKIQKLCAKRKDGDCLF